ncbi:MAG: asparagine synthase-related protein [Bryobacteraceae bacterium]
MIYRAFHTTRESRREIQPHVSGYGHALTWDGRLDNREELIACCVDALTGDTTDVSLVMAAYLRWGTACFERLIGDFACVLWQPSERKVLLVRDFSGVRPIYYHADAKRIVWSSDLASFLALEGVSRELNDEYIAGFLTRFPEPWQTPYRGVHAVPPGAVVEVSEREIRIKHFWKPDPDREIRYRSDSEYEDHFRQLFREAVRCRLQVAGPVCADLSGGLDSSSIVCMADQIIEAGEATGTPLHTISYVYDIAATSDERQYIRVVEEHRGQAGFHIREDDFPCLSQPGNPRFIAAPTFSHCFASRMERKAEILRDAGARVLLTGQGGDQLMFSGPSPDTQIADLLVQAKIPQLIRALPQWSDAMGQPVTTLLWSGLMLLLPRALQTRLRPKAALPAWFNPDFVVGMRLGDRMVPPDPDGFRLPSQRDAAGGFLSVVKGVVAAYNHDWIRVDIANPFQHRPLVEFMLAVPIDQKVRPGESRSLMRRSLRELLPQAILTRRDKRGPDEALCRAIAREWRVLASVLADGQGLSKRYIDSSQLLSVLDRARNGYERHTFLLLMTLSTELWLQSLAAAYAAADSTTELAWPNQTGDGARVASGPVESPRRMHAFIPTS